MSVQELINISISETENKPNFINLAYGFPLSKNKKNYRLFSINNRRYLGNKFKLNKFIKEIIEKECGDFKSFADLFAGTGSVASMFQEKELITNDILYSNFICHNTWFGIEEFSLEKITNYIESYNAMDIIEDNYMSLNYSDTYFSKSTCRKIGYIRENIESLFKDKKINQRERSILITSLLYAMDKIANTCGHYDAYRKNGELDKRLELTVPNISKNNPNNQLYNLDINKLVKFIEADVVYLDPPYNSRQYCDAYHLIENVAKWKKPKVEGVAKKMDRASLKSDYCTQKAVIAFEDLIKNIKSKYIVLSYNNMANKGNGRSNAKITDEDILRILKAKGEVKVFSQDYKAFSTGKSSIEENEERLFVCKCHKMKTKEIIQSPLNYTGGKFKLLPQILPLFPKNIDNFVDLFCGGCNVGINVNAKNVIFNDNSDYLTYLFNTFKNLDKDIIFEMINEIINKYGLSNSFQNGYAYYNCDGNNGLSSYNKNGFLKLRENFNKIKNQDYYYFISLYVLIIYSFNNQIRFNRNNQFNLPVGKRDFNEKMQLKLSKFVDRLKEKDYRFVNSDFRKFPIENLTSESLVYVDPPYLITCATYNEQNSWTESDEKDLLCFLDTLNDKNIKFALSNVLRNKGKENNILINWIEKNKNKYNVINLNYTYGNSNYQTKDKTSITEEVLIMNYKNEVQ